MKKKIAVIFIAAVIILLTACSSQQEIQPAATSTLEASQVEESQPTVSAAEINQQDPQATEPVNSEDDVTYISNFADKSRTLDTFDKLNGVAEYVVTGVCVSSGPVFQNDTLYTISEVKLDSVYRGGNLAAGDTILIVEMGGRTTHGEYVKNCHIEKKAFETVEPVPSDYKIVMGTDGYFPLKEGEQVLLFLTDATGFLESIKGPVFSIWGTYDGKLFLQPDGVTYAFPLPSDNGKLKFGEGKLKITVDELKTKVKNKM